MLADQILLSGPPARVVKLDELEKGMSTISPEYQMVLRAEQSGCCRRAERMRAAEPRRYATRGGDGML